jgi:small conductance mechanosensitive channel
LFQQVSDFFRDAIDAMNAKLTNLRKQRGEAPAEELSQIEDELVTFNLRLEDSLEILLKEIENREAFGLDSTAEREFLSEALADRAELLVGRIELARENEAGLAKRIKADPENTELRSELDLARQRLDLSIGRLTATVDQMKTLGLDTAEYQQLLFEVTGEITTGILSREVLSGILASWWENALDWLKNNGPRIFFKTLLFLLILLVFRILSRIARKIVRKAIRTSSLKVSQLLERTTLSVTGAVVMIFGLLVALSQLGVEVAPLLAGLGVAGFIIGFALQDTLGNFAAGFMILLYRPYDVGDLIETAGAFGKVNDMTLVSTTLLTLDHQTLVIPNSKIWGDVIKNVTAQKIRRIDMVFGISYSDDIPHAEKVLEEILESHDAVLESPEPVVKLHNLGDSSVDFIVRPWVKTDDYWDVYWHVTREVKMRFDAEGISIPFPQRDVHLIEEKTD